MKLKTTKADKNFENPVERCLNHGPSCLSLRECLILLLGAHGTAKSTNSIVESLLEHLCPGLRGENQERAFFQAMEQIRTTRELSTPGLKVTQETALLAMIELAFRFASLKITPLPTIPHSKLKIQDLAQNGLQKLDPKLRLDSKEWLGFIPFFNLGAVGEWVIAERGVRTHVNVDPSELFTKILALKPRAIILGHNHPSGNPTPSPADLDLTARVDRLCHELNILLLGHWVVAPESEAWIPIELCD